MPASKKRATNRPRTPRAKRAKGPRAAIYHRVSTTDQDPRAARRELRQHAKRLGAVVELEVEETGSGARNDRPGLLEVLDAARRGELELVLVWKLDRFGRSALDLLANLRELVDVAGVRFVATTQGLDLRPGGDAMSRLMLQVLAAVAEFEREMIGERTRLGLDRARARGATLGRPKVDRPDAAEVRELRRRLTWAETAEQLGATVWACRRALAEAAPERAAARAKKGRARSRSKRPKKRG